MSAPIRLVCFDLGGVIIRICRSWAEGCRAVGLDVRGDVDAMLTGAAGPEWSELNDAYQRGEIAEDEFARRFCELLSGAYAPEEIVRVHRAWTLGEYPRIGSVIARIHDAGLETAVLSNTCHEHWLDLLTVPAVRAVRHRFASHLLAVRKPDAAAYRAVEEGTGHAGPAVLFFDDLPENIDAARALEWRAERIDPAGCTASQIERVLERVGV